MDGQIGRDPRSVAAVYGPLNWSLRCSPNGIRTRVATLRGWCPRPLDDGAERRRSIDTMDAAGARGEGLEPSITGPEPVVLPITPPPNGWTFRLADHLHGQIAPPDLGGARRTASSAVECRCPGCPGRTGPEVLGMYRRRAAAVTWAAWGCRGACLVSPPAAPRESRSTSPLSRPGQRQERRHGPRPGSDLRRQAPDLVPVRVHRRRPGPDESLHRHPPLRRHRSKGHEGSENGTSTARFKVRQGIVGDGYCGSDGHTPA